MGLDTSHNCWHGAYSSFNTWRKELARVAGYPYLEEMQGFGGERDWKIYKGDVLAVLLNHSDCDGHISWRRCRTLAVRLEELAPKLAGWMKGAAVEFAEGLRSAHASRNNVEFR